MKKRTFSTFLSLASAVLFSCGAYAQSSLLATLNHQGTISTYYGAEALREAHEAATDGDVITLSSGSFYATDIKKAITLRGAGMTVNPVSHTEPTIINNDFAIQIQSPADSTNSVSGPSLTMEGLFFGQTVTINALSNAMFLKCRFYTIKTRYDSQGYLGKVSDLNFIHCRIANRIEMNASCTAELLNSVVINPSRSNNGRYTFTNCYVNDASMPDSKYTNCVIYSAYGSQGSSLYYNNLFIPASNVHINTTNSTNVELSSSDENAKSLIADYKDDNDYVLSEGAKALVKGTDGTEVGIHGGSLPYDPIPTNPQITKFNVAAKSTADGKLSVDIEVNSAN